MSDLIDASNGSAGHEVIACQASTEFLAKKYDSCKSIIDQLSLLKEKDLKVEMNSAIVDYYKSGCLKRKEFIVIIKSLIKKLQLEDDLNIDYDFVMIYYNYAVMLYKMRLYTKAAQILEKFLSNLDNLDDETNSKINVLLVDIYLRMYQPYKALALVDSFERTNQSATTNTKSDDTFAKEGSIDCNVDSSKFIFVLFRTCSYLMLRSVKQSKREIKTIVNSASLPMVVLFLKSNIELLRGNYSKSLRLLSTILEDNTSQVSFNKSVMINNNMAVIYFNQRKYNIAQVYLIRAIRENKKQESNTDNSPNTVLNVDLLYNLGITLLMSGHYEEAFEHLMRVIVIYKNNARLWLRIAECCINLHQQRNDSERDLASTSHVIEESFSRGTHRKFILKSNINSPDLTSDTTTCRPSLPFAAMCLDNALHCLNHLPHLRIVPVNPSTNPDPTVASPLSLISSPSTPLSAEESENVRCSVLTAKSYVHLKLNNPVVALHAVTQLLAMPKLSGLHRYLGQMYRAEALLHVDRLSDIVELLNVDSLVDITLIESDKESTASQEVQEQADSSPLHWFPRTLEQARALMLHNLAVTYALRGENLKAKSQLNKAMGLLGKPYFAEMSFLRIYIDLMEGENINGNFIDENFGHLL